MVMATKADDVHFDLAMSSATSEAFKALAAERQLSLSDIMQRAMALFTEAEKARKRGQSLGVLDADKKPIAELVGF